MSPIRSIEGTPIEELIAGAVLEHWLETAQPATRTHIGDLLGINWQRLNHVEMDLIVEIEGARVPRDKGWVPTREFLRREIVKLRDVIAVLEEGPLTPLPSAADPPAA